MNVQHSCSDICKKIKGELRINAAFKPAWNSLTHLEQAAYIEVHPRIKRWFERGLAFFGSIWGGAKK